MRVTMKELIEKKHVPWKCSKTVVKMIKSEGFPGILIGKDWYFSLADVDLWFKRRAFKAS